MGLLNKFTRGNDVEASEDRLGGGQFHWPTGTYNVVIEMARVFQSEGHATGIAFTFVNDSGKKITPTEWVASGDAKGNKNYYERDGKKHYLPGFIIANDICRLTVGIEMSDMETDKRLVEYWSPEDKSMKPQNADVLVALIGEHITLGVQVERTNQYKDPAKECFENVINKVFHGESGMTVVEVDAGAKEAVFLPSWQKHNTSDYVIDNFDAAAAAAATGINNAVVGLTPGSTGNKLQFGKKD